MANTVPFYRMYLNEKLRKFLGINLKNKKIMVFKVNNKTYLSRDTIPKTAEVEILKVKLGHRSWFINIPTKYLDYEPYGYKLLNTRGKIIELTTEWK